MNVIIMILLIAVFAMFVYFVPCEDADEDKNLAYLCEKFHGDIEALTEFVVRNNELLEENEALIIELQDDSFMRRMQNAHALAVQDKLVDMVGC